MRKLIIGCCFLMLAGCSTKWSYYFLDWAIEWEMAEYVDLNSQQEQQFEAMLTEFLIWHRQHELPLYVEHLRRFSTEINQQTLSAEMWSQHVVDGRAHWYRLFQYGLPKLLPMAMSYSDQQVSQIMAKLNQDQQALIDEYEPKTEQELIDEANDNIQQQLEDWTGSVSDQQITIIADYNRVKVSTLAMWLNYRKEWVRQMQFALEERDNKALLEQRLTVLMTEPEQLRPAEYQQQLVSNSLLFGEMLIQLRRSFSAKQLRHFNKKLDELITDLEELSQQD